MEGRREGGREENRNFRSWYIIRFSCSVQFPCYKGAHMLTCMGLLLT